MTAAEFAAWLARHGYEVNVVAPERIECQRDGRRRAYELVHEGLLGNGHWRKAKA